jgi:pyruvate-formate lyase
MFISQAPNEKRIQREREKVRKQEEKERKKSQSRTRSATTERDVNSGYNDKSKARIIMLDDSEEFVNLGVCIRNKIKKKDF